MPSRIALVGDYSPDVIAHRAIPLALEAACRELDADVSWSWIHTSALADPPRALAAFAGVWLVPASPYASMAGALGAVRFARETRRPFLGTCGGFQHALIEFARNAAGLAGADHAETNPQAATPVVARLSCSLVETTHSIRFTSGSRLAAIYRDDAAEEGFRCNFGPNPAYRAALERAGLRFTAFDEHGEIRGGELPAATHPFFLGTLFQPERTALRGVTPPLARAFVEAVARAQP